MTVEVRQDYDIKSDRCEISAIIIVSNPIRDMDAIPDLESDFDDFNPALWESRYLLLFVEDLRDYLLTQFVCSLRSEQHPRRRDEC